MRTRKEIEDGFKPATDMLLPFEERLESVKLEMMLDMRELLEKSESNQQLIIQLIRDIDNKTHA
jgi:predicted DNA-binding protein YlxM (UPF0122 family)